MNKRNSIQKLLGCGLAALAFTACSDVWDDHYTVDPTVGSNTTETLWDLIAADTSLTQFAAQLKRVGYDTLLSKDRYYTVWAPVNGFLAYATQAGVLENDSLMEIEFIQNHIADYSHVGKGTLDKNKVKMLNKKLTDFVGSNGNYTFKGIELATANTPAKNGILHRIGKNGEYAKFAPNIWEYLDKHDSITAFRDYIKSFTKYEINNEESVEGPLDDEGKTTYLLKVIDEKNTWWKQIGEFNNEDSSYTVIVPTNAAWKDMLKLTKTYYVMDERTDKATRDSLQKYYAKSTICKHLAFSNTIQKDGGRDSLISNYALLLGEERYPTLASQLVFRYDEKDRLFENEIKKVKLSNGTIHIVNKLNYSPFKCWHDTIIGDAEALTFAELENESELGKASYTTRFFTRTDLKTQKSTTTGYLVVSPLKTSGAIQATFDLTGILSAKYRIKLVIVPAICDYPELIGKYPELVAKYLNEGIDSLGLFKPTKFDVTLNYPNEKGTKKSQKLGTYVRNGGYSLTAMDTITLESGIDETKDKYGTGDYTFTFPSCEAILPSDKVTMTTLNIKANVLSSQKDLYDRTLRIDRIILEPVE